jgi:predicted naringenin-chalcone synthase
MSSATILFVLKDIWEKTGEEKGAPIFGVAFGPGLTMESLVMTIV